MKKLIMVVSVLALGAGVLLAQPQPGIGRFSSLITTGTTATSLTVGGGITAGTGAVAVVNTTGKIPAISSTYFADLSAANLTTAGGANLVSYIYTSTTYTPVWSGGSVAIGNGSLTGFYQKIGRLVHVQIYLVGGTTTNWGGATAWSFSIPFTVATGSRVFLGPAQGLDLGTGFYTGLASAGAGSGTVQVTGAAENAAGQYNSTSPFAWGASDTLSISFIYESDS